MAHQPVLARKRIFSGLLGWIGLHLNSLSGNRVYYWESGAIGFRAGHHSLSERWSDIEQIADFRPQDEVLDLGCAEGLISLEIATKVRLVRGIEISEFRVNAARKHAARRGVNNASFEVGSITDLSLEPESYDIVLLLAVYGMLAKGERIEMLESALRAARRQVFIRQNIEQDTSNCHMLYEILECLDRCGFEAICLPMTKPNVSNLIVGNRRNTDARISHAPPMILLPTEFVRSHPVIQSAETVKSESAQS